ncbi:hypothetical protein GCM10029978_089250 [Actinoallomurus acanthiterrae]
MQIADAVVHLRPLTLVDEGDDVLVGDPESGSYVAIPAVGAVVIRALQRGDTVAAAAAEAERAVGEPVDVAAFVDALRELGFVADDSDQGPSRTAVVQQRRWAGGPARERVRPLFSRVAWLIYAGAFVFCAVCFVARPADQRNQDLPHRSADRRHRGPRPGRLIGVTGVPAPVG